MPPIGSVAVSLTDYKEDIWSPKIYDLSSYFGGGGSSFSNNANWLVNYIPLERETFHLVSVKKPVERNWGGLERQITKKKSILLLQTGNVMSPPHKLQLTPMKRRLSDGPPAGNWSSHVLWKDPRTLDKEEHCVVPPLPGMAPEPSSSSFFFFDRSNQINCPWLTNRCGCCWPQTVWKNKSDLCRRRRATQHWHRSH